MINTLSRYYWKLVKIVILFTYLVFGINLIKVFGLKNLEEKYE